MKINATSVLFLLRVGPDKMATMALRLIIFFLLSSVVACSFVDVREDVSYDYYGNMLTDTMLQSIKPNVTSSAWVLDNLGEPHQKLQLDEQAQIWVYNTEEQTYKRTRVFLLYNHRKTTSVPHQVNITIRDDLVVEVGRGAPNIPVVAAVKES